MQSWSQEQYHQIKFDQIVVKDEKAEAFCKCPICFEVFQDPICCDNCENHFCKSCIATWNQRQPIRTCPLCHQLKEKPAQRILKNILSGIEVFCANKQNGCEQILQYSDYQRHLNIECQFKIVKCQNVGCVQELLQKDLKNHDDECPHKLLECQWCHNELQRQHQKHHQETCNYRCVRCDICHQDVLYSLLQAHQENCPEKEIKCSECDEAVKIKEKQHHLYQNCLKVPIECSGCKRQFPRNQINEHESECDEFEVVCPNCDLAMKRKIQDKHNNDNCIQWLKSQLREQKFESQRQIDELKEELNAIKHIIMRASHKETKLLKFSVTYKHPEIHLYQQATYAQIQDAYSIQLKDRFVYVDLESNTVPIEVQFNFPVITDRFVALGIADISNLSQKKDYYKLNHLAYLFSANGVIYSSHSAEDNGRKKDFRFDTNQKVTLSYDPLNCKVSATNQFTGQSFSIDIPEHLIQMHGKSFYPVICLRGAGDQVQIIN